MIYPYKLANFNGRSNRSKVKTWWYLAYLEAHGVQGASINRLHNATGVPLATLRVRLDIWWSWGRVSKKLLKEPLPDGSTVIYRITAFGKKYLDIVPEDVLAECIEEIEQHQEEVRRMRAELQAKAELLKKQHQESIKERPKIPDRPLSEDEKYAIAAQYGGVAWLQDKLDGKQVYHIVLKPFNVVNHLVLVTTSKLPESITLFDGPREAYQHISKIITKRY